MENRERTLGFTPQKEVVYNKLLPYADKLDEESKQYLAEIKIQLSNAIIRNEIYPEGVYWITQLLKYIKLYGRKFSKEDHCHFIRLMIEILLIPDLALHCVVNAGSLLFTLLKKVELLTRDDLQVDWRPLYKMYERTFYSTYEHQGMILLPSNLDTIVKGVIRVLRPYFSVESTQEMLDEWRPLLCPYDTTMLKGINYFSLFLCTKLPPHQHDKGFKLWLDEFIQVWESCQNCPLWENHLLWLFARLARDNIGYINWEPYIPTIFNRLMRSFNLPCGPNKVIIQRSHTCDSLPVLVLIASMMGGGSSCQTYINSLFKALESYYHPSNNGRWMHKLQRMLHTLPVAVIKRINRERYKKPTWETPIPSSHCLTDTEITEFVLSLKPVVLLAMFSKVGSADSAVSLHNLAILRPELIIPPIIERLYSSLETLTEPHRLTAAMHCMVSISRSMVQKNSYFPEGPSHVLPLLMGSLPGLDPNDIRKCLSTFHLVSTISTMIFFVDCSKGVQDLPNLTEMERELCLATAAFEDFVLQFMDRCFSLIENSTHNHPSRMDRNLDHMSTEETFMEACMASTFSTVLTHSSPDIFKVALKKLFMFVSSHVFEIKVAGKNAANMCRCAAKINSELTLQIFLPHYTRVILSLTEAEEVADEERLDNELLFSLQLVSEIIRCDGTHVLKYIDNIKKILKQTLHLKCREGYSLACAILRGTLKSFTLFHSQGYCSIPDLWPRCEAGDNQSLINDWGKSGDLNDLGLNCHVPSKDELDAVQKLLELFLLPELESLRAWATDNKVLRREEIHCSLVIIDACLYGASSALPIWSNESVKLSESTIPMHCSFVKAGYTEDVNSSDGRNFRSMILEVIHAVLDHMLLTSEDDTKSMVFIISVYQHVLCYWGVAKEDFETKWKGFHVMKKSLENKLHGQKQHIRALLVDRIDLQHEMRVMEKNSSCFTEWHVKVMHQLYRLSISHYCNVRSSAQTVLQTFFTNFPYSYKLILPELLCSLAKDPTQFHEEFKGVLYLMLSFKQKSIVTARRWDLLEQIWPALVSVQLSEKPSIIKLLDTAVHNIQKFLDTFQIELQLPESVLLLAKTLRPGNAPPPTDEDLSLAALRKAEGIPKMRYLSLVEKLVALIESGNLHWRLYQLAVCMLLMLIRYDIPLPVSAVRLFVRHLVHDTLMIRKLSISAVSSILQQQKRSHTLIQIDPCSSDLNDVPNPKLAEYINLERKPSNIWLQYNSSLVLDDQAAWDRTVFVHKTHIGFSVWPSPFKIYAPDKDQPKLNRSRDELSEEEQAIYDCFSQKEFVDKLIGFHSLEERKGHDKFDVKRFDLFKSLFRNYGDIYLVHFLPHLVRLVEDNQESSQRCAAELFAGLLRGSKHWTFSMMTNLRKILSPILVTILKNVTPETANDWTTSIATASECRDPNKYSWFFEILMEKPIIEDGGSFLEASWLLILISALMQQEWRVCELTHRLLSFITPKLSHSYHNVRERIGSILSNIFMYDIPMCGEILLLVPKRAEFLNSILANISGLLESDSTAGEKCDEGRNHLNCRQDGPLKTKDATNLFHTICRWLKLSILRTHYSAPPEIYQILPVLCSVQNDTSDESLHKDWVMTFTVLSQALLFPNSIDAAIHSLKQILKTGAWYSKVSALVFLRHMVFSNIFTVINNEQWLKETKDLVLCNLHDERVEVRESAAESLSGLLHCNVLKVCDDLLDNFKQKCNKKLRRRVHQDNKERGALLEPDELCNRHAGILGLCACINSFPYDVPDFMPEVLVLLADHLHDPQPIQTTIKKTLSNFRRTHYDSWRDHKLKFTEDQLTIITDLLVSPSYYA